MGWVNILNAVARFGLAATVVLVFAGGSTGMVAGDRTQLVDAARDPMNEPKWYGIVPRHLYLEWNTPVGVVRAGQMGSYWGTGILANDGDHPTLFGDYSRGAITERLKTRLVECGLAHRTDIHTFVDFIDADEKRI